MRHWPSRSESYPCGFLREILLDQNLPPLLVDLLAGAGHDVVHVQSLGMHAADDSEILQVAVDNAV